MPKFIVLDENNMFLNIINADSLEDANLLTGKNCVPEPTSDNYSVGEYWDGTKFINKEETI